MAPSSAPTSKNRTSSFLQGLGRKLWKTDAKTDLNTTTTNQYPIRFKDLSVLDSQHLSSAICCSHESMSPNRFQTVPEQDFDIISYRIHHLPNRLLMANSSKSTRSTKSTKLDHVQLSCKLHRTLDYELMDDTLYVISRTITKCARQFYIKLENARGIRPDRAHRSLPPDIVRTFATLQKGNDLISNLCKCANDPEHRFRTTESREKRVGKSDRDNQTLDQDTPCCPACPLAALSTNISFFIALRAFLLSYIPRKNHSSARRLAFLNGWILHCPLQDRRRVLEASQDIYEQINRVLYPTATTASPPASQVVPPPNTTISHSSVVVPPPSPPVQLTATKSITITIPPQPPTLSLAARTRDRNEIESSDCYDDPDDGDEYSEDEYSGRMALEKREYGHNSSGFTDHVEEPQSEDVQSYHSPHPHSTSRMRRQLERQQIHHQVVLPDPPRSQNNSVVQPAPKPPLSFLTEPTRKEGKMLESSSKQSVSGKTHPFDQLPSLVLHRQGGNESPLIQKNSGMSHPSRRTLRTPTDPAEFGHLPHIPSSNHSSRKHDSVNEPASPRSSHREMKESPGNVSDRRMSQVYRTQAFQQSLDDVYRVLSSMESLHKTGAVTGTVK